MRQKTMRLIFWGVLAVVSSSLLVVAGVWVGERTGGGGRDRDERAETDSESEFENPLLGKLAAELDDVGDAEKGERDKALDILREADPILSRIKRENREALRRANQHPRIVRPEKKAPAPEEKQEKTPEPEEKKPENPNSDSPGDVDPPSKGQAE